MSFTVWISRKLKLAGKSRANATGVAIAVGGVALALVVMELTLAIVYGFKHQIAGRIMGFDGQVTVMPAYSYADGASAQSVQLSDGIASAIQQTMPGASATLKMHLPGILKTDNDFAGMYFVGYGDGYDYAFERSAVAQGVLPDFSDAESANKIAISKQTAASLALGLGDKVNACFFVNDAIKSRKLEVAAIYDTGFSDYDKTIVFAPIATLQRIAGFDQASGHTISVRLPQSQADQIEEKAADLQRLLLSQYERGAIDEVYPVDNVKHTGAVFFNWLQLLDTNVVVIFILMACVAAFTLVSSMFILILDRIPTIGLLRSLGATRRQIRLIFVNLAMKTVGLGLLIGNAIGIGLQLGQLRYAWFKLNPEMYYLPYVPVEINWMRIVWLNIAVAAAAWLVLVVPSRVAANIRPASTLRFE